MKTEMKVKKKIVQIVRSLIKEKRFFRQDLDKKKNMLLEAFKEFQKVYGVSGKMVIKKINADKPGVTFSHYNKTDSLIFLDKPSVVNFLHEFRHLLQFEKYRKIDMDALEADARLWSLNVFKKASKRAYENAEKKGLLIFDLKNIRKEGSCREDRRSHQLCPLAGRHD